MARYGASKNELALTFDDGPDPQWTPKILDVLKREHVPATFFLIGIQAEKFGSLTQRIYREGHEIGNHTFTHPDISSIGSRYMKVELNLTEQLFASRLGIRTILFRPPYSVDAEPDTEDEVRPARTHAEHGLHHHRQQDRYHGLERRASRSRRSKSPLAFSTTCRRASPTISSAATSF